MPTTSATPDLEIRPTFGDATPGLKARPTSGGEPFISTRFAKWVVIANGLVPAAMLAWDAWHHHLGVNEVNFAIRTTGLIGLICLTLSLAITPLRAATGWHRLIGVRRNLGVLGFTYIATHFLIFFVFDREASVTSTWHEIITRVYLWYGTTALVLMIPLALTSTDAMVQRLGASRWKLLHRLTYLVIIGGIIHYYLLVKSDTRQPIAFAIVIGALLGYRLVAHYVGLRKAAHMARVKPSVSTPKHKKFWSGELEIARIFQESHDVKTFRLVGVDGGPLPFTHVAGQYLNLALTIDGRRVNRSYTIASSPTRGAYCEISVKHVPDGYGSRHLHETWREGQRVKVSAPAGKFVFTGADTARVVLIAGGIGVTPMMSVVRSLTDRGWRGDIFFLLSIKVVRDFVFREELAYLQTRFPNLHVRVAVSRDPDTPWDGARGQIDRALIADFVPDLSRGSILLCGPGPMMTAMREILVGMGVPDARILQEAFISASNTPAVNGTDTAIAPVEEEALPDGAVASILFKRAGKTAEFAPGQTVLEAAEDAGVEIPFECRSGICGQCKTPLLSGRVVMETEEALSATDRAKGLILACQSRALQNVEVDA